MSGKGNWDWRSAGNIFVLILTMKYSIKWKYMHSNKYGTDIQWIQLFYT